MRVQNVEERTEDVVAVNFRSQTKTKQQEHDEMFNEGSNSQLQKETT